MNTREYLGRVRRFDKMIETRLEEIERLRTMATNISPKYSEDKVQTSFSNDKIGVIIAEIAEKEDEVRSIVRQKGTIIAQIEGIDDFLEYVVLTDKYVKGLQYKEIAGDIERTERHTMKIHDRAIANFEIKYAKFIK